MWFERLPNQNPPKSGFEEKKLFQSRNRCQSDVSVRVMSVCQWLFLGVKKTQELVKPCQPGRMKRCQGQNRKSYKLAHNSNLTYSCISITTNIVTLVYQTHSSDYQFGLSCRENSCVEFLLPGIYPSNIKNKLGINILTKGPPKQPHQSSLIVVCFI